MRGSARFRTKVLSPFRSKSPGAGARRARAPAAMPARSTARRSGAPAGGRARGCDANPFMAPIMRPGGKAGITIHVSSPFSWTGRKKSAESIRCERPSGRRAQPRRSNDGAGSAPNQPGRSPGFAGGYLLGQRVLVGHADDVEARIHMQGLAGARAAEIGEKIERRAGDPAHVGVLAQGARLSVER